jgi:glycolate oxidase FAD binding subunit
MSCELRTVLERELGAGALRDGPGPPEGFTVETPDVEALGAALRLLGEAGGSARIRGMGTHDGLGNVAETPPAVLSTAALRGVEELDTQDGVVRVRAGTPLGELCEAAAPHGWEVPLGGPPTGSLGGTLATAAVGPRRLGQGPTRDSVLGLDVVLATGQPTRCGGRVVKNVTGFDLAKLYTGSFGCLGVIESAWLRLRPLPETVAVCAASLERDADPVGTAVETARRATVRCAALLDAGPAQRVGLAAAGGPMLVVELAGSELGVRGDLAWLAGRCEVVESQPELIDALARAQRETPSGRLRARLAVLPSGCSRATRSLRSEGAQLIVHAGIGLIYAELEATSDAVAAVERIAAQLRMEARFEALSDELKRGRDVFGVGANRRAVVERMRALKARFDPAGVLNPGRFLGRL